MDVCCVVTSLCVCVTLSMGWLVSMRYRLPDCENWTLPFPQVAFVHPAFCISNSNFYHTTYRTSPLIFTLTTADTKGDASTPSTKNETRYHDESAFFPTYYQFSRPPRINFNSNERARKLKNIRALHGLATTIELSDTVRRR